MWIKNVNTTCSMPQQWAYFQTFKQLHGNKYNWAILISIRQVNSFIGILSVLEDSKKINDNCGICAKGCAANERTRSFIPTKWCLSMECMWTISGIASVQHIQPKDSGIRTKCSQATQHETGPPWPKKTLRRMWSVCTLRKGDGRSSCSVDLDNLCLSQFPSLFLWLLWLCETCGIWKLCEVSREHNMKNPAQVLWNLFS